MSTNGKEHSPDEKQLLSRREFVVLLGGMVALAGCGGSNTSVPSIGTFTRLANVAVDTSQIGGSGLAIQSLYQSDVAASGVAASIKVAAQIPQLLVVTDSANKVRAAGFINPAVGTALTLDAASTAAAMVFLTPGILSKTPSEAAQRMGQIQKLHSFLALVTYLTQKLPTISLQDLRPLPALNDLVAACVNEWLTAHGAASPTTLTKSHPIGRDVNKAQFSVAFTGGSHSSGPVVLENFGWRFVNVVRQDLDSTGKELHSTQFFLRAMKGAAGFSVGSLFTDFPHLIGDATTEHDAIAPSFEQKIARYFVRGPGFAENSVTLPPSITGSDVDAWMFSIIYYLAFPLFDAIGSIASIEKLIGGEKTEKLVAFLESHPSARDALDAIQKRDINRAAADIEDSIVTLIPVITAGLNDAALIESFGLELASLIRTFGYVAIVFGAANLLIAVSKWITYPHISSVDLVLSNDGKATIHSL